jgi:hypothetical protein
MSIAFDASFTHMYEPGTRRHIQNALKAGASIEEISEVLKICVAQGVQAINLGVPILEEELARDGLNARGSQGRDHSFRPDWIAWLRRSSRIRRLALVIHRRQL